MARKTETPAKAATTRKPRVTAGPPAPVVVRRVPKECLMEAARLAAGRDVHIEVNRDGTVTVANGRR